MNRLAEEAQNLLDSAVAAVRRGERCQEMTILIGRDGGIQMCADSDWPLDSLMLERGARTGYRVSPKRNSVRVEGREGPLRCLLEQVTLHSVPPVRAGALAVTGGAGLRLLSR